MKFWKQLNDSLSTTLKMLFPAPNFVFRNLLLPDGVPQERQKAKFIFKIYKADGLPKMNAKLTEKLKTVFQGESRDLVDPFVEISFCGQKVCTTSLFTRITTAHNVENERILSNVKYGTTLLLVTHER